MSRKLPIAVSAFVCMTWICMAETPFLSEHDNFDNIQKRIEQEKNLQDKNAEKGDLLTPEARRSCCSGMSLEDYCRSPQCRQQFCGCNSGSGRLCGTTSWDLSACSKLGVSGLGSGSCRF